MLDLLARLAFSTLVVIPEWLFLDWLFRRHKNK